VHSWLQCCRHIFLSARLSWQLTHFSAHIICPISYRIISYIVVDLVVVVILKVCLQHMNYLNSNSRAPVWTAALEHVLRTNRTLTVLVSLQPINTKYGRDADARDQWTRRVTGSTCSGQFGFVQFRASVSGLMALLVLWFFHEIYSFIHSFHCPWAVKAFTGQHVFRTALSELLFSLVQFSLLCAVNKPRCIGKQR